jgi:hypothetical protein
MTKKKKRRKTLGSIWKSVGSQVVSGGFIYHVIASRYVDSSVSLADDTRRCPAFFIPFFNTQKRTWPVR